VEYTSTSLFCLSPLPNKAGEVVARLRCLERQEGEVRKPELFLVDRSPSARTANAPLDPVETLEEDAHFSPGGDALAREREVGLQGDAICEE
jgi:hypothetical protein